MYFISTYQIYGCRSRIGFPREIMRNFRRRRRNDLSLVSKYFMSSLHFRGGWKYYASCPLHTIIFTVLTTHARTLLPTALASVSFGFVLVQVRVRSRFVFFYVSWYQQFYGKVLLYSCTFAVNKKLTTGSSRDTRDGHKKGHAPQAP